MEVFEYQHVLLASECTNKLTTPLVKPNLFTRWTITFYSSLDQLSTSTYYLTKEKYKMVAFPQIALASRGGKRQEKIGLHYSLSNLNKV